MLNLHKGLALSGMYLALILVAASPSTGLATPVTLQNATATYSQGGFSVGKTIDGNLSGSNGWAISGELGLNQTAVWETTTDLGGAGGTNLTFTLPMLLGFEHTLGKFLLSVTTDNRANFADGHDGSDAVSGQLGSSWTALAPLTATDTDGATLTINGDHSITVSGTNPDTDTYTITATTALRGITGFRLDAYAGVGGTSEPSPNPGPGRSGSGNFVLNEFEVSATAVVPEPSTFILLVLGAFALYAIRKR